MEQSGLILTKEDLLQEKTIGIAIEIVNKWNTNIFDPEKPFEKYQMGLR